MDQAVVNSTSRLIFIGRQRKNFLVAFFVLLFLLPALSIQSQVSVNTDASEPEGSAMLEVKSLCRGMLPPRLSNPLMKAIEEPATGLMIYNTDEKCLFYFEGLYWINMCTGDSTWVSCGTEFTDDRDHQKYRTILIGTQCWMAENLNIGTMINGSVAQSDNGHIEKYCYDDDIANCKTYGGLYQWNELMDYHRTLGPQGICPPGWHVPTDNEWCILENYVDAGSVSCATTGYRGNDAGGNLKENGTTHWSSPNTGATNSSGFIGLAAGRRHTDGSFLNLSTLGYFWTSTEDASRAWSRSLRYDNAQILRGINEKTYGFSVRCLQND